MLKHLLFVLAVLFCASVSSFAQDKADKVQKDSQQKVDTIKVQNVDEDKAVVSKEPWNKVCPVKGNEIDKDTPTVEYNGKVYGFCCPGCDSKFKKDPEKYLKNLSEDGKKFIGKK